MRLRRDIHHIFIFFHRSRKRIHIWSDYVIPLAIWPPNSSSILFSSSGSILLSWNCLNLASSSVNFFYKAHLTFNPSYLCFSWSLNHAKLVFFWNSGTVLPTYPWRYRLTILSLTLVKKLNAKITKYKNIVLWPTSMTNLFNFSAIFFTSFPTRHHLNFYCPWKRNWNR